MDDNSEVASTMTRIEMMGDLIVMHEDVTTVNIQGLHTSLNEEDIFAKKELPANDTHFYDEKHVTIQVARNDDMHRDVDNKHMTTLKRPEAYKAACKIMMTKTNLKEVKDEMGRRRNEILANKTYQEEDVVKTNPETNIVNISMGPHTKTVEDPIVKEVPPADDKTLAEYEEEPHVQDVPLQKELPADNKVVDKHVYEEEWLTKYEYP